MREPNASRAGKPVRLFLLFLLLEGLVNCAATIGSDPVDPPPVDPDPRMIAWSPGIPDGIPDFPVAINVKNAPYGAKGDGVTDDTAAVLRAVRDCPARSAVHFPAGTYRLTSRISINRKSIVLRGDGLDRTFLKFESGDGDLVSITGISGPVASTAVTSGLAKGSTNLTVASAAGLAAGDYLLISQSNDPSVCEGMRPYQTRAIGQTVRVTAVSGNRVTVNRPLYYTYEAAFSPLAEKFALVENAGVESLRIERTVSGGGANIFLGYAAHCWVRNVESNRAGSAHVTIRQGYANVVQSGYFHHGFLYSGGAGYGIFLLGRCTDNLVEDNILYHLRHGVTIEWGGCGNVVAYNYATRFYDENYPDTQWQMQSIHTHGGHPYMNLFEGNVCPSLVFDNALGSSRHNTAFRNHAERGGEGVGVNLNAVEVQRNNLYQNIIGNVLCRPGDSGAYEVNGSAPGVYKLGCNQADCSAPDPRAKETLLRHGNFDFVTGATVWDSAIGDRTLPRSYYLAEKPAFFGSLPWPAIGPDLDPMAGELPAKMRFEGRLIPR